MLWLRLALAGVVLAVVAAAAHKFSSFLAEKDQMIQERDQQILNLRAQVEGLRVDKERLQTANASLEQDNRRQVEEAARARLEANRLQANDTASSRRLGELERKLADRERVDQIDRVAHSRRAELVVRTVNRSAKCEIENFFQTDGQCRSGEWVPAAAKTAPKGSAVARPASAPEGASNAQR